MGHRRIYEYALIFTTLLTRSILGLVNNNWANLYFLEKQTFLFEVVRSIQEPLQNQEWINIGESLALDRTLYLDFNIMMEKYLIKINANSLLPSNEIFILTDKSQLEELKGLYFFLYNARDFATLKKNICWARSHVQAQMFVFALTQVLMKREDFRDLNLPKIYEIWPQHFFADKYVRILQHFNYAQWSRTDMFEHIFNETNMLTKRCSKLGQWWCEEELQFKIYKEKQGRILPMNVYGGYRNTSKRLQALEDVDIYWLPVDFSREVAEAKEMNERSVSYLIEDKFLNAYWYYVNMGLWFTEPIQSEIYTTTIRDWWFWNLQQVVARYKVEEISSNSIHSLDPFLMNFQGGQYKPIDFTMNRKMLSSINILATTIQNVLNEQTYELANKTTLHLTNPEHFEYFVNQHFAVEKVMSLFMSITNKRSSPTVFQNFETMLRSKEFYYYAETILNLYRSLKANFQPYKAQDLLSVGVTLNNVDITELRTYFEIVDTDVTNLLRTSEVYFEGKLFWFKSLLARQQNLQHQPFKLLFNVTSDKAQAVIVRTFLGIDCFGATPVQKRPTLNELFQLDTFVSTLAVGVNLIERESKDFYGYVSPSLTYTELYHLSRLAFGEKYQFPLNITSGNCRFPSHLKLPKGLPGQGRAVNFIFVVTTYNYRFHRAYNLDCDFSSGILAFDDMPPGFPFDREIPDNIFAADNVMIKKIKIYHDENVKF